MSERSPAPVVRRRDFLHLAGVSAIPAAIAATSCAAQPRDRSEESRRRYQETDHVKTFYRVNRYPD